MEPQFKLSQVKNSSELIQNLWSNYGTLKRVKLNNGDSAILKTLDVPETIKHPRGRHSQFAHQRKLNSYQVESWWYKNECLTINKNLRMPLFYDLEASTNTMRLLIEDLNPAGFISKNEATISEIKRCIAWLAKLHGKYLLPQEETHKIWKKGSYWHLETRPEEFELMSECDLKSNTHKIDDALNHAKYKTIIHGDAKLANFMFSDTEVAAVDFQYIGFGVGVKDFMYFISSVLSSEQCYALEESLLKYYFQELKLAISQNPNVDIDFNKLEQEYRKLYAFAWADFTRFLMGWAPDHFKLHDYAKDITQQCLSHIKQKTRN